MDSTSRHDDLEIAHNCKCWNLGTNGSFDHIPDVLKGDQVRGQSNHVLELSRMLFKPIANNVGSVTWSIIILEHRIVIEVNEAHKRLQMIIKQLNIAFYC